jgi:tetratricopeptide (TPR) repeat protein
VAHKYKEQSRGVVGSGEVLRTRIDRAASEGRFQQALDLARQLYKFESTPTHLTLLKNAYLGRGRQLREGGYTRDAATTLEAAVRIDPANSEWLTQIAQELAACGAGAKAMEILRGQPSATGSPAPVVDPAVLARLADSAVQQGASGKSQLPAELQPDFERVLLASRQIEQNQDDAAKETLHGIGLKSPFLEWKVFLRGLQAYYQNDDVRAVENWQRLNPDRIPAKLAAPLRLRIDAAFRAAQPPETQAGLQKHLARLQATTLTLQLQSLRSALADSESRSFANAFRLVETLLPALRIEAPHLEKRLANVFYWAIMQTGPDDALRYKRVFGLPRDDPGFYRIIALVNERSDPPEAHKAWKSFEKDLADHADAWPAGQVDRARAMVWLRMARNAANIGEEHAPSNRRDLFFDDEPPTPEPLKPGAVECFQKAIQLAPDMLEAHEDLFLYQQEAGRFGMAERAARALLKRFPDHVPTLAALGDLLHAKEKYAEALKLLDRALAANPLDRRLRSSISAAHLGCARLDMEAGRFDEARAQIQSAFAFHDRPDDSFIRCRLAALEFKLGNLDAAEEQVRLAQEHTGSALGGSFRMLTEAIRVKLDKPLTKRFEKEFLDGLKEPPVPAAVVSMVEFADILLSGGVEYTGQATHIKKVQAYAEKGVKSDFSETDMARVARALYDLGSIRAAQRYARAGASRFKQNPVFPLLFARLQMEASNYYGPNWFDVRNNLDRADKLAKELPKEDPLKASLLEEIAEERREVDERDFWGSRRNPFFGGRFDEDDDE